MSTAGERSDFSTLDGEEFPFCVQVEPSVDGCIVSLTNQRDAEIIYKCMVCDPDAVTPNPSSGMLQGHETAAIVVAFKREPSVEEKKYKIKFLVTYAHLECGDAAWCYCAFPILGERIFEKTITIPHDRVGYESTRLISCDLYGKFKTGAKGVCWGICAVSKRISEINLTVISALLMVICVVLSYRSVCRRIETSWIGSVRCNMPIIKEYYIKECFDTWIKSVAKKLCP